MARVSAADVSGCRVALCSCGSMHASVAAALSRARVGSLAHPPTAVENVAARSSVSHRATVVRPAMCGVQSCITSCGVRSAWEESRWASVVCLLLFGGVAVCDGVMRRDSTWTTTSLVIRLSLWLIGTACIVTETLLVAVRRHWCVACGFSIP
jgi:hypothetical protein